jgi:class 3 adenylate cyclase/tetratricopeptide (TPR) repeat protein
MFSDMTGYSRLMGQNEERTLDMVEEMTALMTRFVNEHNGHVLKYIGDAVLATFDSASDAVTCAVTVQQDLAERNRSKLADEQIRIRIGIHIGDIVLKEGDVFGDGVNIAARLEPQARPGGICISQAVYDAVKSRSNIRTVRVGRRKLKNIQEPMPIYHILIGNEDRLPSRLAIRLESSARQIFIAVVAGFVAFGTWWGWREHVRASGVGPSVFTIAMPRFASAPGKAADEGKIMQDLIRQRLQQVLGHERYVMILHDGIKDMPRTHAEATDLGEKLRADIVLWGEVLILDQQLAIKPYITSVNFGGDYQPPDPDPLYTKADQPDSLKLREQKAFEVGNTALLAAAKFYSNHGIYVKALSYLEEITPPNVNSLLAQAWIHYNMKQMDVMDEEMSRAAALNPKELRPRQLLALCHALSGNLKRAMSELKTLETQYPHNAKTLQLLGTVSFMQGKLDDAIRYDSMALARDPKDNYAYADLGKIYTTQGKFAEAADAYWSWIRLYPYDIHANALYYLMARRSGRAEQAQTHLKDFLLKLPPSHISDDAAWPRAVVFYLAGKTSEADFTKLVRGVNLSARYKREQEGNFYLGMSHLLNSKEVDHLQLAKQHFERCVSIGLQYDEYYLAKAELNRIGHGIDQ